MNKADLIERVAKDAGINKSQAETTINSLVSGIEGDLKKGGSRDPCGIRDFFCREPESPVRVAIPRPGQPIKIAAKKVAKFCSWSGTQTGCQQKEVVLTVSVVSLDKRVSRWFL